jgi:hypothetical protein
MPRLLSRQGKGRGCFREKNQINEGLAVFYAPHGLRFFSQADPRR